MNVNDVYPATQGGYFMSQGEEDAVVGRLVREYREARSLLVTLEAEAKRIGGDIKTAGEAIASTPQCVAFDGEAIDSRFAQYRHAVNSGIFDVVRIKKLTNDYRNTRLKADELEQQLNKLGFKV